MLIFVSEMGLNWHRLAETDYDILSDYHESVVTNSNVNVETQLSYADSVLEVACATDATAELIAAFQETERTAASAPALAYA